MKLRSLELAQFRKFDGAVQIGPLADGINVLCGPNECGKSTLLAAIRGVLFERHTSKAEAVRRMRHHRGETSPRIALNFETERGLHRIEKRFLHREPFARLTLPDGTRVEGDRAEEALQALLAFRPAGKQGARPEDAGIWNALWVTQREAVDQPALADPARMTLNACLEGEIGAVTGGERGQRMLRDVREELARLRDGRGQPKGRLKETAELLAGTEADLMRLNDTRRALADDVAALQGCRRKLAHATEGDPVAKSVADLEAAKQCRDAVLRYADRHAQAVTALRLAELAHTALAGETARRRERQRQLTAATAQAVRKSAEEQEARAALAESDAALGRFAAVLAQAEQEAASAVTRLGRARRVADLATRTMATAAMAGRLTRAEAAQADVNTCTGELTAIRADVAAVQAVHAASRECAQAQAVLDAQATAIILDLEPGADGRVLIDGVPVASTELRAIADVTIDLPGIGRLVIRPAISDRDTLLGAIARAERKLAGALEAAGASDAADAERRLARRMDLEQRLAQGRRALDFYAPADPESGLAAGAEALSTHVAVVRRQVAAELAELGLTEPPPAARADAALKAAAEAKAAEAVVSARAALTVPSRCRDERAAFAAPASQARSGAEAEVARLRHEMAEAAEREADDALASRLEEAAREVLSRQDALALVEHARPEDTLAAVDARIARDQRAIDAARENQRRLQQDIAVLLSRIRQEEGDGVEEQIAMAERRREDFARERNALQREAEVLELLRDTLLEAEHAANERYLAPVVRRMTPYLRGLFPGVRVHCDADFRITGVTRDGGTQEEFARLSDGTQEQIAILCRLAFADLLIDRGRPAMVILDDALVFADRDRMERMFNLLADAASRMQLLVLTCRGDVFARLGGHRLEMKTVAGADSVA